LKRYNEKEGFPTFSKGFPRETKFSGTFPKVFQRFSEGKLTKT